MNDVNIMTAIRRMLANTDKSAKLTPLDLIFLVRLLAQQGDERDVYPSQGMLAMELCTSVGAIARSAKRLKKLGWITVKSGGKRNRTNFYGVNVDKLPTDDLQLTITSPTARHLAGEYVKRQFRQLKKKRIPKNQASKYSFSLERMLQLSHGDEKRVVDLINFAFDSPKYKNKALRAPFELYKCWAKIGMDFDNQPAPMPVAPAVEVPAPVSAHHVAPVETTMPLAPPAEPLQVVRAPGPEPLPAEAPVAAQPAPAEPHEAPRPKLDATPKAPEAEPESAPVPAQLQRPQVSAKDLERIAPQRGRVSPSIRPMATVADNPFVPDF
jgi:hypothetical protein